MKTSTKGEVHSVYKNTINFIIGEKLIAIHPSNTIKTPMSLRIKENEFEFEQLDISIGEVVNILDDKFIINGHEFDFVYTKSWNPNTDHIDINMKDLSLDKIKLILSTMNLYGNDNSLKEIVQSIVNEALDNFTLQESDYFTIRSFSSITNWVKCILFNVCKTESSLNNLIGLGIGLTPSGDDFLTGLLSVFSVLENKSEEIFTINKALKIEIKDNLEKTTFLSKEFLSYATKNKYSEIFHELYDTLKKESKEDIISCVRRFMEVGSSSGMDTLSGIVLGMYIANELRKDKYLKGASYD